MSHTNQKKGNLEEIFETLNRLMSARPTFLFKIISRDNRGLKYIDVWKSHSLEDAIELNKKNFPSLKIVQIESIK